MIQEVNESQSTLDEVNLAIDKIDAALPTVRDLEASDKEMDDLADLATESFKDLMDIAQNVEPRFSGPIIQSASTLLGHAITAKMAKIDKKLKMVDLQLKKVRLDQTSLEKNKGLNPAADAIEGKGVVLDRNALLREILNKPAETDK